MRRPKIDLDRTSGKNFLDELVKPTQKLAKLVTKTSSKMYKPKTYDEAVNDLINGNKRQETINKKF